MIPQRRKFDYELIEERMTEIRNGAPETSATEYVDLDKAWHVAKKNSSRSMLATQRRIDDTRTN